jgi:hypothetical protein
LEFTRNGNFVSFKVHWGNPDILLKLDFVNDMVPRFGPLVKTALFDRTDSIQNILSNKISAIFRFAASVILR